MRVLVLCSQPDLGRAESSSVAATLEDLGCRILLGRLDLGDLVEEDLLRHPPTITVVEANDEVERAGLCLRALGDYAPLADTPTLLVVTVPKLSALDFSLGFDDFALAPIVPAELYARLRQLDWRTATFGSEEVLKIGDLVIDVAGYEARLGGRKLAFTHQEFELLRFLAQNRGRVFSRDQLLTRVWGYSYAGGTRTVDIHVRRVRAKLGPAAASWIVTVRNVGYKMRGGDEDG